MKPDDRESRNVPINDLWTHVTPRFCKYGAVPAPERSIGCQIDVSLKIRSERNMLR
jgi:hypothetical protein